MASMETGEMFTQAEYDVMPTKKREELKLVNVTESESRKLTGMNRKERRAWLKANKKFSRRERNAQVR